MTAAKSGFDPATHLDAMASLLGLAITAQQRQGVIQFLSVAQAMAEIVRAAPLAEDTLELAPVFRPGRPQPEEKA